MSLITLPRVVEIRIYDSAGLQVREYDIDVSTNLLSAKWTKPVYRVLRECIQTCIKGGVVTMRGVLLPK
jgi:hypothetical protein